MYANENDFKYFSKSFHIKQGTTSKGNRQLSKEKKGDKDGTGLS